MECVYHEARYNLCSHDSNCRDGLLCVVDVTDRTVCKPQHYGDVGVPCHQDDVCRVELYCNLALTDPRCIAPFTMEQGQACEEAADCVEGLTCIALEYETDGSCRTPLERGQRCRDHSECAAGLLCFFDGTSRAFYCLEPLSSGEACEEHWHCQSHRCSEGRCE